MIRKTSNIKSGRNSQQKVFIQFVQMKAVIHNIFVSEPPTFSISILGASPPLKTLLNKESKNEIFSLRI